MKVLSFGLNCCLQTKVATFVLKQIMMEKSGIINIETHELYIFRNPDGRIRDRMTFFSGTADNTCFFDGQTKESCDSDRKGKIRHEKAD